MGVGTLQSSDAVARQLQKATQKPMSSPCPLVEERRRWPQCQAAPARPVRMSSCCPLVTMFSVMSSSCSCIAFFCPSSGVHWPRLPAYLRCTPPAPVVVLYFSCLLFLFSSCSPLGVFPSCCPVILLALSGHSLSFFCPLDVFVLCFPSLILYPLLSSSCPPKMGHCVHVKK